jgi:hypothetical protein
MLATGTCYEGAFKGFWGVKICVLACLVVACFFMPDAVFTQDGAYAWIARIFSGFFLVIQVLILIDFAYTWNEQWVQNAYEGSLSDGEPSNNRWLIGLVASAFALFLSSVIGIVLLFVYYAGTCADSQAFVSVTLLLVLGSTVLALFRHQIIGVEGAVLPSAVVSFYAVFLTWQALQSNPNQDCQPSEGARENGGEFTGIFIATISLMWTCYRATQGTSALLRGTEIPSAGAGSDEGAGAAGQLQLLEVNNVTKLVSDDETGDATTSTRSGNVVSVTRSSSAPMDSEGVALFFLLMLTASLYMSMVLTNWGDITTSSGDGQTGTASMYIKAVSSWLACLIYIWTLVAPLVVSIVCGDDSREFD